MRLIMFLSLISASTLIGQTASLEPHRSAVAMAQSYDRRLPLKTASADTVWVIGQDDPDEVVRVTSPRHVEGDIRIVNRGQLIVENTEFSLDGSITIADNGLCQVNGGDLTIVQHYIYEHEAFLYGSGQLRFNDVDFTSSGHSWSIGLIQNAHYEMKGCQVSDGFITVALLQQATADISDSELPGEFLCMGENELTLENCQRPLIWLVLPEGAEVETALPGTDLVTDWHFSNTVDGVTSVPYSVTLHNCAEMWWGMISNPGTEAVFSDSDFRVVGLMFTRSDSTTVTGITNQSTHHDETIDITDRTLHLINSTVNTWSFYPSRQSVLNLENCVTGEVLAQDTAHVTFSNSVCDGSGGYIGAMNHSEIICYGSLIRSQCIARMNSVFVLANCAVTGPQIAADEQAILYLAGTLRTVEPEAHGQAVIFEADVTPVEGQTESLLPVLGTARLLPGPDNPITLTGYSLAWATDFDEPDWQSMGPRQSRSVLRDTLGHWNTAGLSSGQYALQLTLHHSYGDSISMGSYARLTAAVTPAAQTHGLPDGLSLGDNYPNPFNPVTTIPFTLPQASDVSLILYDIRGRQVQTILDDRMSTGRHEVSLNAGSLPGGVYFYRLTAAGQTVIKSCLLVK